MLQTLTRVTGKDSWYRHGRMELTRTHGIDMDSRYRHELNELMVYTWTHGIDMYSWYRHGLMVLKTPMVLTQTGGIVSIPLITQVQEG